MSASEADDTPSTCRVCGNALLLRRPGRDTCAACGQKKYHTAADYPAPHRPKAED